MQCRISLSRKYIARGVRSVPQVEALTGALLLAYVCMSEDENIKLVERIAEHSILYDLNDYGYTRKGKIVLVWEKNGKDCKQQ
jgi:hypothetical protein